ncbi:MAG: GTPase Era [Deltaproteobacteria bacterium]|nr:GTPase Era [Deltaproteobacteria bacterium]MBW2121601.1 GTPase Era [Deltaproteobacteria bacterium]
MDSFKSGFISILGKPNVGKSTLLNRILGEKIAIISDKPQTTRTRVLGIKNLENAQLIFYDTPGIHRPLSRFHQSMVRAAFQAGRDADLLLLLTEAHRPRMEEDEGIVKRLRSCHTPLFLIINKIDLVKKAELLPLIERYQGIHRFEETIPISALNGEGVDRLVETIEKYLPQGPRYFPEDITTDQSERFLAAEMIREKIFQHTYQEVPYSVGVTVESFRDEPDKGILSISAVIVVEKASQRAILIGRGGGMLKRIGTEARQEMELFFGTRVFLQLWVKVIKGWSENPRLLGEMGYG